MHDALRDRITLLKSARASRRLGDMTSAARRTAIPSPA